MEEKAEHEVFQKEPEVTVSGDCPLSPYVQMPLPQGTRRLDLWLECETKDEEGERLEGQTLKFKLERETSAQIRNMIYTLMQQAKSK